MPNQWKLRGWTIGKFGAVAGSDFPVDSIEKWRETVMEVDPYAVRLDDLDGWSEAYKMMGLRKGMVDLWWDECDTYYVLLRDDVKNIPLWRGAGTGRTRLSDIAKRGYGKLGRVKYYENKKRAWEGNWGSEKTIKFRQRHISRG